MSFNKDGETKVFITKAGEKVKTASEETAERYGVDNLIEDANKLIESAEVEVAKAVEATEVEADVSR